MYDLDLAGAALSVLTSIVALLACPRRRRRRRHFPRHSTAGPTLLLPQIPVICGALVPAAPADPQERYEEPADPWLWTADTVMLPVLWPAA